MEKRKAIIFIFTIMFFAVTALRTVSAETDYDAKIQSAQKRKQELENRKKQMQSQIEELEKDKSDVIKYINKLDGKMDEVTRSLNEIKDKISGKKTELRQARVDLKEAEESERNQYDAMKKRIKYMYENGNSEYYSMVFEAKSLSEFLNRSEYVAKISEYDEKMLSRYQASCKKIENNKMKIENTLEELTLLREEADAEHQVLLTMTENKKVELQKYKDSIEVSKEQKEAYEKEAAKQEEEIENLLLEKQRQIEKEEAARRAQQSNGDGSDTGEDQYSGATGLRWPLRTSGRISSYYGPRKAPASGASTYHRGIDVAVAAGTPIVASGAGKVVTASYSSSAGNYIMLYHGESTYTVYMHCSRLAVDNGTSVKKGQVIAYVGSTGISTGNHLHFGVMRNGNYVNPLSYVSQ